VTGVTKIDLIYMINMAFSFTLFAVVLCKACHIHPMRVFQITKFFNVLWEDAGFL
jgi:hypothetical protein